MAYVIERCLAIRRYTADNISWTPIVSPMGGDTFSLREVSKKAFNICTDPSNAVSWDTIEAGMGFIFQNVRSQIQGTPRFSSGDAPIYIQATDGAGITVVGYFGL